MEWVITDSSKISYDLQGLWSEYFMGMDGSDFGPEGTVHQSPARSAGFEPEWGYPS
jgi:hypothetical protein